MKKTRITMILLLVMAIIAISQKTAFSKTYYYKKATVARSYVNSRGFGAMSAGIINSSKTYKVLITARTLNVRAKASLNSGIIKVYYLGDIVDIIGASGNFLKTSDGFIAKNYTKQLSGMYVTVKADTQLLNEVNYAPTNRTVVVKRGYLIAGSKDNNILIYNGRVRGYIPQQMILTLSDTKTDKITLGWENVTSVVSSSKLCGDISSYVNTKSDTIGLDVLSPTWFDVGGDPAKPDTININDIANKDYITKAHNNGYEVWARFGEMNKKRAEIEFNNKTVRNRIIKQLEKLVSTYDVDGINIDYEALGSNNRDAFTDFVKQIYPMLKKYNVKVSIDVTKYTNLSPLYSLCYDRPQLAKYSDYLVLMGYDEHVAASTEPGSVASYSWVESAIADILNQGVPASKLILGVPFYLRDFSVIPYDAVIFNKAGKLYNVPYASDNNKLLAGKNGNIYKFISQDNDWYKIDVNGITGFVKKTNGDLISPGGGTTTSGAGIDTTNGGIDTTNGGIDVTAPGVDVTTKGAINVQSNSVVKLNQDSAIYKSEYEVDTNKLADIKVNGYFKYKGQTNDFYIIDYNGAAAYVTKSGTSFVKANSRTIGSSAISMTEADRRTKSYAGSIAEDELAKQSIAIYYINDVQHEVWLETPSSMAWRMDMVNDNELAGTAAWSLNWKPTDDIWTIIKSKMKN